MSIFLKLVSWKGAFFFLAVVCSSALLAQDGDYDRVGTPRTSAEAKWGGLRWLKSEQDGFQGRPRMQSDSDSVSFVTVAYDRYVSFYDLKNRTPRWVAYVTDRASAVVTEKKSRTGADFKRPSGFFTEAIIAEATISLGLEPAEHFDYSDRVPEGLPFADQIPTTITPLKARSYPAIIERGHLAPNNTMKTWGTPVRGQKAQAESFSLANVVPQMSAHNAPIWSELEAQCLAWAKELGKVFVVVGPIYANPSGPSHIKDRRTGELVEILCPDALFCVVIGKRNTKISAVGFIMPHITARYSYPEKAVPIDQIEQATGVNFMPLLNEPNALEQAVDQRWLQN